MDFFWDLWLSIPFERTIIQRIVFIWMQHFLWRNRPFIILNQIVDLLFFYIGLWPWDNFKKGWINKRVGKINKFEGRNDEGSLSFIEINFFRFEQPKVNTLEKIRSYDLNMTKHRILLIVFPKSPRKRLLYYWQLLVFDVSCQIVVNFGTDLLLYHFDKIIHKQNVLPWNHQNWLRWTVCVCRFIAR